MLNKWLSRTTPFVIVAFIVSIVILYELIIEGGGPEGWRNLLLVRLFFFLLVIILIDSVLKIFIPIKNYRIWIIETVLFLAIVYYWIVS